MFIHAWQGPCLFQKSKIISLIQIQITVISYQTKLLTLFLFIVCAGALSSCKENMTEDEILTIGISPCRKPAAFIKTLGFDPNRSAFSTETDRFKGVVLLEAPLLATDTIRKYQHPTWAQFGYMASITTDDQGNAYSFPIPFINTENVTVKSLNSIYKIDHESGEMKLFATLPKTDSVPGMVAFGLLGIYFDCHGKKIYAASVNGSTREKENGSLFVLDQVTGKVMDRLDGVDAMGLCVGGVTGEKKLYFGKARSTDIYSVVLDKEGLFDGKPQLELSLDQLGPRGDDKARRIRFNTKSELVVHGIEFNFNLAGQSVKPETKYSFGYNREDKKWILMSTE